MAGSSDIASGRLPPGRLAENFADIHPPLDPRQAAIEASRCYFCYDAPCLEACPTGIDIPAFIRSIATGNDRGAAVTILSANIMGGTCSRVCPVEELCEEACVRNTAEEKPVRIGALQRYATDRLFEAGGHPFTRAPATGRRVAVVGAGPAGLACAHRLAMLGHDVVVFEAREKPGGLNEYGIAAYKVPDAFAGREVAFILAIGGIELKCGAALGRDVQLGDLKRDFDAVFLGLGHNAVRALGIEGESIQGVIDAVDYIAALRQADLSSLPVGRRVVVIGGGNTAIDIATQTRRLGAEDATIVYRRGPETMSATWKEQDWARSNGVRILNWARPHRIRAEGGRLAAVELEETRIGEQGGLDGTGRTFTLPADQLFKAVGQFFVPEGPGLAGALEVRDGRIVVNGEGETSMAGVFAGGDCIAGIDLTVSAVEDGKRAATAIDRRLKAAPVGGRQGPSGPIVASERGRKRRPPNGR